MRLHDPLGVRPSNNGTELTRELSPKLNVVVILLPACNNKKGKGKGSSIANSGPQRINGETLKGLTSRGFFQNTGRSPAVIFEIITFLIRKHFKTVTVTVILEN